MNLKTFNMNLWTWGYSPLPCTEMIDESIGSPCQWKTDSNNCLVYCLILKMSKVISSLLMWFFNILYVMAVSSIIRNNLSSSFWNSRKLLHCPSSLLGRWLLRSLNGRRISHIVYPCTLCMVQIRTSLLLCREHRYTYCNRLLVIMQ